MTQSVAQGAAPAKRPSYWSIISKNFSTTVVDSIRTIGRSVRMLIMSLVALVTDTIRGRLQWKEALNQVWYMIGVTSFPGILIAIPFGIVISIQVGNIIAQLGADSLQGAAGGLAVITQGAPIATGLLLAGAGASAIAADLGARTIREETDAMRVMGINPLNRLVVPRLLAAWIVAPLLNILVIAIGTLAGYLVAVGSQGVTPGAYWLSFGSFAHPVDVYISLIKSFLFGTVIAIIGCQRGLEARGGSRGVADAVNATVVLSFVVIFAMNLLITQVTTMFFPMQVGGPMTDRIAESTVFVPEQVSGYMATVYRPRGTRWFFNLFGASGSAWSLFDTIGHVVSFIAEVIRTVPHAIKHYRSQIMYILTDITWGRGALVVGGGTAPVLAVLGITVGGIVAVQGFAILNMLGMGPLTAVVASFANTREFAPMLAGVGFAAQAGCRMTAEIGAMRINEEIDALESLGLRSVSFVVTTRVLAGLIAVVPVYLITLILSWLSCAWVVKSVYSMPSGTYDHYFSQFVSGSDIFFSVIKVAVFLTAVIIIHCYQGFFASGGPEGVGTASGRAIRASLVAVVVLNLVMTVALWGFTSPVYFKG